MQPDMEQRSAEWFALKAGKFSGSRFGDLMAKTKSGPAAARKNLISTLAVERITGEYTQGYTNYAMQRGIDMEPEARFAYEVETGDVVDEVAYVKHDNLSYVLVSPDGLIGSDELIEIKCPSAMDKHMQALLNADHAREYYWQIQGQLWVTGRSKCQVVSYDPRYPEGLELAITEVERDESAIAELERECIAANDEVWDLVNKMLAKQRVTKTEQKTEALA